jgi:hypothetical protein
MTVPASEVDVITIDPLSLERQRRRYASRAVAYLVLLNGVAALVVLASLPHVSDLLAEPDKVADAMLVFGAGAAVALGSAFFAYLRRTVRLQAPERVPLRVSLWWLSVLAAIAATACFLIGLDMAGRAALPERVGISSGAKPKDDQKDQGRAKRQDDNRRDKRTGEERGQKASAPESKSTKETRPAGPQPLSRTECNEAARTWNETTNTCG